MATGLNRVSLIGNLGKDPEVRYTQSGVSVGNLRLGVTESRKEGDEYKNHTEWVSVVCFGKTAENAAKFLQKGRQVFVEGRLQTRSWEDKTGQTRYTTEVVANQLLFLGSGQNQSNNGDNFSRSSNSDFSPASSSNSEDSHNGFVEDDDIPF
ncbi:MAG: single-stranded DNA-binding protein [Myxococcales bacterium]|nr:single-stranded DNA-binding protein [Myxococcales bacterium]USN51501.1 MAG: single-stranded DNA-binding protein [Myxococcales bacterium]